MPVEDRRYLIVGGAPKAGTTSLFNWLSAHSAVCPSTIKEVRFFLDPGYPLPSTGRFNGSNLQEYDKFFKKCDDDIDRIRLEATPDYLYSESAVHIASLLPKSRIVFVLRDPVERMISWYTYALQRGFIAKTVSFDQYVKEQCEISVTRSTPIHLRALDQCRYWKYLPQFQQAFGNRMLTVDFVDLAKRPSVVFSRLCEFAGIADNALNVDQLVAGNASYATRSPWLEELYGRFRRRVAYATYERPNLVNFLRVPNRLVKLFLRPLRSNIVDIRASESTLQMIREATRIDSQHSRDKIDRKISPIG